MAYLKNILIAIDQFINTVLGGNPDETMSSRAYRLRSKGIFWPSNIVNAIFPFAKDHCEESLEEDE